MEIDIDTINKILSNDEADFRAELHCLEMNDNNKTYRNKIKEKSFEMGFLATRKILVNYLKNKNKENK